MNRYLFTALAFLSSFCSTGQIFIQGKVLDPDSHPVELASIRLLQFADSSFIAGAYSDTNGSYQVEANENKSYLVEISFLGFETHFIPATTASSNVVLPDAILKTAGTSTSIITIESTLKPVERKADRTVVNVDAFSSNAGASALEALEKSPGVTVDQDGNIRLRGREGVTVYVDGKPTYLSGPDLANYLRSLPASSIKQIELITNPPAHYDAAGNAGIIQLITKRNKIAGFSGSLTVGGQAGQYGRLHNTGQLNFNWKKWSIYTQGSYSKINNFQDLYIFRYYKNEDQSPQSGFAQNSYIRRFGFSSNDRIGIDYYATDRTIIGVAVSGFWMTLNNYTKNKALVTDSLNQLLQTVYADNQDEYKQSNLTYTFNIRHTIDSTGKSITADVDFVDFNGRQRQEFMNSIYNNEDALTYRDYIHGKLPSNIQIFAAKSDYNHPFANGLQFQAGVKTARTKTDNEALYSNTLDGVTTVDNLLTNHFIYDEWIHAAYINFSKRVGAWDLQLGLRGEQTNMKGNQLGNEVLQGSKFNREYTNLFPTFFGVWHLDSLDRHQVGTSLGRRIDRPAFEELNPFISPLDKFTYYGGNPLLLPVFTYNASIFYTWNNQITFSVNYSQTTDGINETLEIVDQIYYSRPKNVADSKIVNVSLDGTWPIGKRVTLQWYGEAGHTSYTGPLYNQYLDAQGWYGSVNGAAMFSFNKEWSAEIRGDYNSNFVYSQLLIGDNGSFNIGVSKKLLKDKATVRVTISDPLYIRRNRGVIRYLDLTDAWYHSQTDSRFIGCSFTWRFGSNKSGRQQYQQNGSADERARLRM